MSDIRVESHGFNIGRWYFPPFALRSGECVTLRLPMESWVDEPRIIQVLMGKVLVPGLNLHAAVEFAKPASSPSGWRRWLQDPTPFDWLKQNSTLSEGAIQAFLVDHKMDRPIPLSRHAGTPRAVLGLAAAYARRPEVVVFATTGLDPLGKIEACRVVAGHLAECAAIYLAWPFLCQGQEHHYLFPDSSSVTVIDQHQPAAAGIS